MKWRWIVLAFLMAVALGALAAVVTAQEVIADSVTVRVLERPHLVILEGPQNAYRGDILSFRAKVEDQNGNPTMAFLIWSVSDTAKARIISLTDSTVSVQVADTGAVTVRVEVGPLDSLRVGFVGDDGLFAWEGEIQIGADSLIFAEPWENGGSFTFEQYLRAYGLLTIQMCALLYSGDVPWAYSAQEVCYPAYAATFGVPDAPAGPLRRLTVYGTRRAENATTFAALIRSSPPADRVALSRRVL